MTVATELARGTRRAVDAGAADFARFRKGLDKGLRQARRGASRRMEATDRYVHQHPWMALGVAAGAAALLGVAAAQIIRSRR